MLQLWRTSVGKKHLSCKSKGFNAARTVKNAVKDLLTNLFI